MKIKISVLTLCAVLFALNLPVWAQQATTIPRIGYLSGSASRSNNSAWHDAFRQGLRELGYIEGKNIIIEWRFSEGKGDRGLELAKELTRLKVNVIVTVGAGDT